MATIKGERGERGGIGAKGRTGQRGIKGNRGPAGPAATRSQILAAVQKELTTCARSCAYNWNGWPKSSDNWILSNGC